MRALLLIVLNILISTILLFGGNDLDSLLRLKVQLGRDTNLVNALLEIGDYYENEFPDSSLSYYLEALELSREIEVMDKEAKCLMYIGIIQKNQGSYKKALEYYKNASDLYKIGKDNLGLAKCYSNIGNANILLGNSEEAIEYYLKSLVIYEDLLDNLSIAKSNINIGNIYLYQENYHKALEYFERSLDSYKGLVDQPGVDQMQVMYGISYSYGNMGVANLRIGDSMEDPDSARSYFDITMDYYNRSLEICEEMNDIHGMANCYMNIGVVNWRLRRYEVAIDYYKNALEMRKQIGDKSGIAMVLGNIAYAYISIADSGSIGEEQRVAYLNEAVDFGLRSFHVAESINSLILKKNASGYLKGAYKKLMMSNKALEYAEIYIVLMDSLNSKEKTQEITEIEARYQNEKQLLEIEKLENERNLQNETIARQEAENKKQRILLYSFVVGLLIVVVFSVLLYRLFLQKRNANKVLAEQNSRIKMQKEEIEAHRDEIKAQRDLAAQQRDLITEQKKEITDSIEYAFRIQSAVIPEKERFDDLLKEHFIFYRPRDIVSGDFYWVGDVEEEVIVIAADCTGHGVPGAFMSMLGIAFLNEIINRELITSPAEILNRLRAMIIKSLKQDGRVGDQRDGMDIAVVKLNKERKELEFAGANNPLYLVREGELIETKGDKMPIAHYYSMRDFRNTKYEVKPGDAVYIFTDGYADQFGGSDGKKFKYDKFKSLILKSHRESFIKQCSILEREYDEWKGFYNQIDDVLVIGLSV